MKRKFEPQYASAWMRKFQFEEKENLGSGKQTKKQYTSNRFGESAVETAVC